LFDQSDQPFKGVLPVPELAAESPGINDQRAVCGHPVSGNLQQSMADIRGQVWVWIHIKAQLYCGGCFIDMLPTRPGGTDKRPFNVIRVNGY
jgi:hypothetical protein